MEVITITGYDNTLNLSGKVYVLDEVPNASESELYTFFESEKELYKIAEQENSPVKLLRRSWLTGGSRAHPFRYCFSIYEVPENAVLGWSLVRWERRGGRLFPFEKVEGASRVSELPQVSLKERTHEKRFGIFLSKQEMPRHEDWWNEHIEKIFEEE